MSSGSRNSEAGPSSGKPAESGNPTKPSASPILGYRSSTDKRCHCCSILLRKTIRAKTISSEVEAGRYSAALGKPITVGCMLCNRCRLKGYIKDPISDTAHSGGHDGNVLPPRQPEPEPPEEHGPGGLPVHECSDQPTSPPSSDVDEPLPFEYCSEDSGEDAKSERCVGCQVFLRKSARTKIVKTTDESNVYTSVLHVPVVVGSVLCDKCRGKKYKPQGAVMESPKLPQIVQLSQSSPDIGSTSQSSAGSGASSTLDPSFAIQPKIPKEEQYVEMPFPRVISSHKSCFVCGSVKDLTTVPYEARKQAYAKRKIFIPKDNRCCKDHLIKKKLFEDDLKRLQVYSHSSLVEAQDLKNIFDDFVDRSEGGLFEKVGDCSFSDESVKAITGLTWEGIKQLEKLLTSMRASSVRNVTQALVTFLFKLRTGDSNSVIASVLGLPREQQVTEFFDAVLKSFERDVLPRQFGVAALTREEIIQNQTSEMAKKLLNLTDQVVLVFDGTYITHQKSTNNEYQRRSYSGQKKRHLCKPFTVCTTNGYVVDSFGPYPANWNDAKIMEDVMKKEGGLKTLLKKGDILIVDRGFRDVVGFLEAEGFVVMMPALKGQRKQLTTAEANESRKVTKLRWVVEAVHGVVGQKYGLLHQQVDNKLLPKIGSLSRISCFINNLLGKRFESDVGRQDVILRQMMLRDAPENSLAKEVEEKRLGRRKLPFRQMSSSDLIDFPQISEDGLKTLFTGSYQLSQAVSYLAEIMDENNNVHLAYLKEGTSGNIFRVEVRSRHMNRERYKCYFDYEPDSEGPESIRRYCCDCANGNRTVGCCSHVAAIIYYLSNARYRSKIVRPAEILSEMFVTSQVTPVINEDSDED